MFPELDQIIGTEEIQQYQKDGVVCLRSCFSQEWVKRMQTAFDYVKTKPVDGVMNVSALLNQSGEFIYGTYLWKNSDEFKEYIYRSPAHDIARRIMNCKEKINILVDNIFVKEPNTDIPTPWHSDQSYIACRGNDIARVWMPLDPVTIESSGLEFIRGSHLRQHQYKESPADAKNVYEGAPAASASGSAQETELLKLAFQGEAFDINSHRDDYDIISWDLKPGDAIVFHANILHYSQGNKSSTVRRRAYGTMWGGDDLVYDIRDGASPFMIDIGRTYGLVNGGPLDCDFFPAVWKGKRSIVKPLKHKIVLYIRSLKLK